MLQAKCSRCGQKATAELNGEPLCSAHLSESIGKYQRPRVPTQKAVEKLRLGLLPAA